MNNQKIDSILTLTARVTLFILFFPAGIEKILNFAKTVAYIDSVGLPLPTLAAIGAICVEIIGSSLLLLGYKQRIVLCFTTVFTIFATFIFHAFWLAPEELQHIQSLLFFKNIAVIGGMLALFVACPKADCFSLDALKRRNL